jgi:hypothetical protein
MEDKFQNRSEDFLNRGIRAAVGALPVVGSPILEFLAFVIGDPAQERRDDFMAETLERVMFLEKMFEELKAEALRTNETFQVTFIQAVRIAAVTVDKTKKKILQNAILNSAIISMEETVRQLFMQNLERITPLHAALLNLVNNPSANPAAAQRAKGMMSGSMAHIIEAALPQLTSNREIFDRISFDLKSMGLTATDSFHVMMTGSGLLSRQTTPLGQSFLAFIGDPESGQMPENV